LRIGAAIASAAAVGLSLSGQAQAQEDWENDEDIEEQDGAGGFINPGILTSAVIGRSPAIAAGGEVSFLHRPGWFPPGCHCGVGAFGQVQRYFSEGGAHTRVAAGVQAGGPVGVELGLAYRGANDKFKSTTGVHVAPYVSIGIVSLALRLTMPIEADPRKTHGFEAALAVGVKVPIPYGKHPKLQARLQTRRE
jgi:hypothetical protein